MPRRTKEFLAQFALDSIASIESFIRDLALDAFTPDTMVYDATILRLQFLGFALRDLSKKLPAGELPNYFARKSQKYDALTKDYRRIDRQRIWNTVTLDLPRLKRKLLVLPLRSPRSLR